MVSIAFCTHIIHTTILPCFIQAFHMFILKCVYDEKPDIKSELEDLHLYMLPLVGYSAPAVNKNLLCRSYLYGRTVHTGVLRDHCFVSLHNGTWTNFFPATQEKSRRVQQQSSTATHEAQQLLLCLVGRAKAAIKRGFREPQIRRWARLSWCQNIVSFSTTRLAETPLRQAETTIIWKCLKSYWW